MSELKSLEQYFKKDYHTAFEDLATLMFCTDLGLSRGVRRRINQKGIESDPVKIESDNPKYKPGKYAYQAKYYSDKISRHIHDIKKSIDAARSEGVTHLMFFTNQWLPDRIHKTNKETKFLSEVQSYCMGTEQDVAIEFIWWDGSIIESTLDFPAFQFIRDIYLRDNGCAAFYNYIYLKFSLEQSKKSEIYGRISLKDGYIEPTIDVSDGETRSVHNYLETWACSKNYITVICGEPGHGKTSLCYKAVCDFYKNGWLAGNISNVFYFSLNPAKINTQQNEIDLYSFLIWGGNRNTQRKIIDEDDCKNALIFFDGFDELKELYPELDIKTFIQTEILPFQEETRAHIVLTSRKMAIEPVPTSYRLNDGTYIPVKKLQLINKDQQVEWITNYIEINKNNKTEAARIEEEKLNKYLAAFRNLKIDENIRGILGIPIIFRMIVVAQYIPENNQPMTQIYDKLYDITWDRHNHNNLSVLHNGISLRDYTKKNLQKHALRIFIDNNDTAIADISNNAYESLWIFSFYTAYADLRGKKRIGFLHRSFYHYFLATEIISWFILYCNDKDDAKFIDSISHLSRRKIDKTTLIYMKEIYDNSDQKVQMRVSFNKAYEILSQTGGIINLPKNRLVSTHLVKIDPIERASNIYWNIVTICGYCNQMVNYRNINTGALTTYDFRECILTNADLRGLDLNGVRLKKADLRFSILSTSNMYRADLNGADLSGATLIETNLSRAQINGANLNKARLNNAKLIRADLNNVEMREANLNGAYLNDAQLMNASAEGSELKSASLISAKLKKANFSHSILEKSNLTNADLSEALLSDTNFAEAKLTGINLNNARLNHANLNGCNLNGANLIKVQLNNAQLNRASLVGAKLNEAVIMDADLNEADFTRAVGTESYFIESSLVGAKFIGAHFDRACLRLSNLCEACFYEASLNRAILEGANLTKADFQHAVLRGANLNWAKLGGADLSNADLRGADPNGATLEEGKYDRARLDGAIISEEDSISWKKIGADISKMIIISE